MIYAHVARVAQQNAGRTPQATRADSQTVMVHDAATCWAVDCVELTVAESCARESNSAMCGKGKKCLPGVQGICACGERGNGKKISRATV